MNASKPSLSSRRQEKSIGERENTEEEEEKKDPQEIDFMTQEEVEEYENLLKEVTEAMAKLSIKKIEAKDSVSQIPDQKSVATEQ